MAAQLPNERVELGMEAPVLARIEAVDELVDIMQEEGDGEEFGAGVPAIAFVVVSELRLLEERSIGLRNLAFPIGDGKTRPARTRWDVSNGEAR